MFSKLKIWILIVGTSLNIELENCKNFNRVTLNTITIGN